MKNKKIPVYVFEWVIGAAIMACAFLFAISFSKTSQKEVYEIVVLGDSIVGNDRTDTSVTSILSELSGMRVLNGAFGGSTLSAREKLYYKEDLNGSYSLYRLSRALRGGKADTINMSDNSDKSTARYYFDETVDSINLLNRKQVKYVIVEHGINDYFNGVGVYEENGSGYLSFYAALDKSVKNLRKAFPNAEIVIITPCYANIHRETDRDVNNMDYGGGLLSDYVDAELRFSENTGVMVIDNYHDSEINEDTYEDYLYDGLHTNSEGNRIIAEKIWNYINPENR